MTYPIYFELNFESFRDFLISEGFLKYEIIDSVQIFQQDLIKMKKILADAVIKYNRKVGNNQYLRVNLNNFGIQYAGFLNEHGEKLIWINGFSLKNNFLYALNSASNFESQPVIIMDGGNDYFNTIINLSTEETARIQIHGSA